MAKSSDPSLTRRDLLKTALATAATVLPGAPIIATGASAVSTATAASLITSAGLAKTLGLLYGLFGNGVEPDGDLDIAAPKGILQATPLADLAKQFMNTLFVFEDENASDVDKQQAKTKLLKQLVNTGFRVGRAIKESVDAFDGYGDMLRQWQKNPDSSNETRALDRIIKLSWSYAQGERSAAQTILNKALEAGNIKENPEYEASPRKNPTDYFWDLAYGGKHSKYLFVDKKRQKKLLAQYEEEFEETMEPWGKLFTNLAAQIDGNRKNQDDYEDDPLAEGISENLLNRVRELQSTPMAADLIDAFTDPRDKFGNIIDTLGSHVSSYIHQTLEKDPENPTLSKFKNNDFNKFTWFEEGWQKIFGAKAQDVAQAEFDKGFKAVIGNRESFMNDMPHYDDDRSYMAECKQRSLDTSAMREGFEQEANHWRSRLSSEDPKNSWKRGKSSD